MKIEQPLLDYLSARLGCTYLSDLRFLSSWRMVDLIREIEAIPAHAAPKQEWNDALKYLAGAVPEKSADLAKKRCIDLLKQSVSGKRQCVPGNMCGARDNERRRLSGPCG